MGDKTRMSQEGPGYFPVVQSLLSPQALLPEELAQFFTPLPPRRCLPKWETLTGLNQRQHWPQRPLPVTPCATSPATATFTKFAGISCKSISTP